MLATISAVRFYQGMRVGKTQPLLMGCVLDGGEEIEAVVKLSAKCERGPTALAIEGMSALLGRDLGMPIPEPFAVSIDADVLDAGAFANVRADVAASCDPAFGSRKIPSGFSAVADGTRYDALVDQAAEIFAFDGAILNADRRVINPNCQCDGRDFAIFDHEGALTGLDVLGTFVQPFPWTPGGLTALGPGPGQHVLFSALRGRNFDLGRFEAAWGEISDERLLGYKTSLPAAWVSQPDVIDRALEHLADVRNHITQLLDEVRRVLQ
jgi:hypothetical protein